MKNGQEFYFVYFGSEYMKLDKTHENGVYPWVLEEFESAPANEGATLISHSCGFFEVDLEGFKLTAMTSDIRDIQNETLRVLFSGGEFCNISGLLSYSPKLVKVKVWYGKYFALDYWEVNHVGDDKLIIFDRDDIENIGVTTSYSELDPRQVREACERVDYLSPRKAKIKLKDPNVIQIGDELCYKTGVFLHDIVKL